MKVLRLLHLSCLRAYYGWAMREIHPLDGDVPLIVLRLHELELQQRRVYGKYFDGAT